MSSGPPAATATGKQSGPLEHRDAHLQHPGGAACSPTPVSAASSSWGFSPLPDQVTRPLLSLWETPVARNSHPSALLDKSALFPGLLATIQDAGPKSVLLARAVPWLLPVTASAGT